MLQIPQLHMTRILPSHVKINYSGIPIINSRTSKGKESSFEKWGVKLIQGKRLLVQVIGMFEKLRVREIHCSYQNVLRYQLGKLEI